MVGKKSHAHIKVVSYGEEIYVLKVETCHCPWFSTFECVTFNFGLNCNLAFILKM